MMQKLNHTNDLDAVMRQIRGLDGPSELAIGFREIVWLRVENAPVRLWLSPAHAAVGVISCALLAVFLWGYQASMRLELSKARLSATPARMSGFVLTSEGEVSRRTAEGFSAGDQLRTGPKSSMKIFILEAGELYMEENSHVQVKRMTRDEEGKAVIDLAVSEGCVFAHLDHLTPGSHFIAETPRGRVSVHGTDFILNLNKAGSLEVDVLTGIVTIQTKYAAADEHHIPAGSRALILGDTDGNLLVSSLPEEEHSRLTESFKHIFIVNQAQAGLSRENMKQYHIVHREVIE